MSRRIGLPAALALLLAAPVAGREIEGVDFPDSYRNGGTSLRLDCVGLLRYRVVFRGYVAGLYLPDDVPSSAALDDVAKRLELSYFWDIDAEAFGEVAQAVLERNLDPQTLASLRPRLDRINSWYRDVKPGDRYSLTYVPGRGTELALNGQPLGTVEGADFAAAYYSIWLGPKPIDDALKDQLTDCSRG